METGSIADWVNALATTLTFVGATVAAVFGIRSYQVQRSQANQQAAKFNAELTRQQLSDEMEQARKVAIWPTPNGSIWVANTSELPVYELELTVPVESGVLKLERDSLGPCLPRRSESFTSAIRDSLIGSSGANGDTEGLSVKVISLGYRFTDAAGVRWSRSAKGHLMKISS